MGTLNIKDPEARELASELARRTGQTMTEAVKQALRQQLQRAVPAHRDPSRVLERIAARARDLAALPILDDRSADEIIGYDENGIPR